MNRGHLDHDGNEIIGPCCVCKREAPLCCLPAPVSDFWCDECHDAGLLPYDFLTGTYAMRYQTRPNTDAWSSHKATLAYFAKTEEECWADVDRKRAQFNQRTHS